MGKINDNIEKYPGEKSTTISPFDLYSKEVGDDIGIDRILTFIYEIGITLKNTDIPKSLLCKISNEGYFNLHVIYCII